MNSESNRPSLRCGHHDGPSREAARSRLHRRLPRPHERIVVRGDQKLRVLGRAKLDQELEANVSSGLIRRGACVCPRPRLQVSSAMRIPRLSQGNGVPLMSASSTARYRYDSSLPTRRTLGRSLLGAGIGAIRLERQPAGGRSLRALVSSLLRSRVHPQDAVVLLGVHHVVPLPGVLQRNLVVDHDPVLLEPLVDPGEDDRAGRLRSLGSPGSAGRRSAPCRFRRDRRDASLAVGGVPPRDWRVLRIRRSPAGCLRDAASAHGGSRSSWTGLRSTGRCRSSGRTS